MQKLQGLRKIIVGGNWKCHNTIAETETLLKNTVNNLAFDPEKVEVVVAPIFLQIPYVLSNIRSDIQVSAQNCSLTPFGQFTGEVSAQHLKDFGLNWVILGHSERRKFYHESDDIVAQKVRLALDTGLKVIACIGEKLEERESGDTMKVIERQLDAITGKLKESDWNNVVLAYEPVWAIGTGKVATPEQAQEVHAFIRKYLKEKVSSSVSDKTRIMYGGSVNEKNSEVLISQVDVDGFLVGGASLKPEFSGIIKHCNNSNK